MKVSLVIPAAGSGSRMGASLPKPFLPLGDTTVLGQTLRAFDGLDEVTEVVVAVAPGWEGDVRRCLERHLPDKRHVIVTGGAERILSVWSALQAVSADADLIAVHDAVRPFVSIPLARACFEAAMRTGAALPALPITDTVKRAGSDRMVRTTIDRTDLFTVQTPQVFNAAVLMEAYRKAVDGGLLATDEAGVVEAAGGSTELVPGDPGNIKLTYPHDMDNAMTRLDAGAGDLRIGYGYDVHQLKEGGRLVLGGVEIPHESGLIGHSDADVLLHAITDAILGALALGDIGTHFPDNDAVNKDRDSREFLRGAAALVAERGYRIVNIDATLVAEKPKILPHVALMRERIAQDAGITPDRVSVKATTNEKMGFQGRMEGMSAMATALLRHG